MKHFRCDAIEIRIIATEVDDESRPIDEKILGPFKVFRAKVHDLWTEVDKAVAALAKEPSA
jgi:hypothetical protein